MDICELMNETVRLIEEAKLNSENGRLVESNIKIENVLSIYDKVIQDITERKNKIIMVHELTKGLIQKKHNIIHKEFEKARSRSRSPHGGTIRRRRNKRNKRSTRKQ